MIKLCLDILCLQKVFHFCSKLSRERGTAQLALKKWTSFCKQILFKKEYFVFVPLSEVLMLNKYSTNLLERVFIHKFHCSYAFACSRHSISTQNIASQWARIYDAYVFNQANCLMCDIDVYMYFEMMECSFLMCWWTILIFGLAFFWTTGCFGQLCILSNF